jgi:benzylsuccinate CoA-transferase BbsF subunit
LSSALLDYAVNGENENRKGNRDPVMAPHGVYPSSGEDRWVAVACATDEQWAALAAIIGRNDLAALSNRERHERADELDALISTWTQVRSPDEAQDELIAAGIPAHAVNNSAECAADPQLADHFVTLPHPEHGTIVVEGSRMKLSATPAVVAGIPPVLGQDTVEVITEILGYSDDKMGDLFAAGALE